MNKLFYPAVCLVLCAPQLQAKDYFTGFYLTGSLGGTSAQLTYNQSNTFPEDLIFEVPASATLSAVSPTVMGAVSYAYQFNNNILLGGAFTAGYIGAKIDDSPSFTSDLPDEFINIVAQVDIQLINDFALLFKAGYVYGTSTLFYTFVGPRWGNFDITLDFDYYRNYLGDITSISSSGEASTYELGVTAGLGIQQLISPNYSWSLEYIYTDYGRLDTPYAETTASRADIDAITNTLIFSASVRY